MALFTYDESGSQLQSLLASDPNHNAIVKYLLSHTPGATWTATEFATGTGNITDVKDAGGHQPMLLLDEEGNATLNLSSFPALHNIVVSADESLTYSGSKSGIETDLLGYDTLAAATSGNDSIWSGGNNSIDAGSYDTIWGSMHDTIYAGSNDLILAGQSTINAGSADTIAGSGNVVNVGLHGNDTIGGSADVFTAHDSTHVKLINEKSGAVELEFTNTGQTLTFTNPNEITVHFSDGHILKP